MLINKFQANGACYVYDTWTNELLEVDRAVFDALPEVGTAPHSAKAEIEEAMRAGYFSDEALVIDSFPKDTLAESVKEAARYGPDHLIINITERCNFRCVYCAYSGAYEEARVHSGRSMTWETLEKTFDWYLCFDRSEFSFGFYGGEPLLERDLIEKGVAYFRSKTSAPATFRFTTNASLLDEETCGFLARNNFRLTISIDGPEEVHDRYRKSVNGAGTFNLAYAGIKRLHDLYPDYYKTAARFNMVLAYPARLRDIQRFMDENRDLFENHSVTVSTVNSFASTLPSSITAPASMEEYRAERNAIFEKFREKLSPGGRPDHDFSVNLFKNGFADFHQRETGRMENPAASHGQCVPGKGKLMVDINGNLYMCERVGSARPIGDLDRGLDVESSVSFLREYDEFLREKCASCWAVRLCEKCFVHFKDGDNLSSERLKVFCEGELNRLTWIMARYTELRKQDPRIFDWLDEED